MARRRPVRPPREPDAARLAPIAGALLALVALTFAGVAGHDFLNYDDPDYVTENPYVRSGLTAAGACWALTALFAANWHPVTWWSHMLDVELFGLAPGAHHLMSVAYHGLATVLLLVALTRLDGGSRGAALRAAVVAALFAVHPLHVESVAWIAERKDVLSTVFWMATLVAYAWYAQSPRAGRHACVALLFAVGLATKPMLVTVPFVLLLLDVWPLGRWDREPRARLVVEKLPLLALSAASSAITVIAQQSSGAVQDLDAMPLADRFANAAVACWIYLGRMIWPSHLAVFYPWPGPRPLTPALVAAAGLAAVSVAAIIWRRRVPYLFTGWFWYLGTLVPVLGIVQVGEQAMADRYTYVPLVGIFIAIAWGLPDVARAWRLPRAVLPVVTVTIVAALVPAARAQVAVWRDSVTLWRHALAVTRGNAVAHGALGAALALRGEDDAAEGELQAALRIHPGRADVRGDLGRLYARRGRLDDAIAEFRAAVALDARSAEARHNLGVALSERGETDAAVVELTEALRLNPDLPRTHNALGRILAVSGRAAEAVPHFLAAARLAPGDVDARYNAALALATIGREDEARAQLRAALAVDPAHAPSRELLARLTR